MTPSGGGCEPSLTTCPLSMSGSADILHDPVLRLYHSNDIPAREGDRVDRLKRQTLKKVVHEALQTHYTGLR